MASQSLSIRHTLTGGFCWIRFCMALHCLKDYHRTTSSFDLRPNCPATKAECVHSLSWHLWLMSLQTVSLLWWKISTRYSCLDKIDFLWKKKGGNCCWCYWEFLKSFLVSLLLSFFFILVTLPALYILPLLHQEKPPQCTNRCWFTYSDHMLGNNKLFCCLPYKFLSCSVFDLFF